MTDLLQFTVLVLMVAIGCLVLWTLFQTISACHADSGTVVRGIVWLECIK
jgi:hypothetical protein